MRNLFLPLLVVITILSSCGQAVVNYNDAIINGNIEITNLITRLGQNYTIEEYKKMKVQVLEISKSSLEKVKALDESYKGNSSFRKTGIEYYEFVDKFINDKSLNNIYLHNASDSPNKDEELDMSDDEIDAYNKLIEEADKIETRLIEEQKAFAKSNNMRLEY